MFKPQTLWRLLIVAVVLVGALNLQAPAPVEAADLRAISTGDIAIILMNTDDPDALAFVALEDIPEGEVIRFTDSGWLAAGGFRGNEGAIQWTSPTGGITAGTIVYRDNPFNSGSWDASNDSGVGTNGFNLAVGGDQIIAFQGLSTSPAIVYAVNDYGGDWQTDATSSNNSALPSGLVNGTTAVAPTEYDNIKLNCAENHSGTKAELLAYISNSANWTGNNTTRQSIDAACSFTITGGDTDPAVASTNPLEGGVVGINDSIDITFNEAVTANDPWYLECNSTYVAVSSNTSDNISYTVSPDSALIAGESCVLTVTASAVMDQDATPQAMAADFTLNFSVDEAPSIISTSPANSGVNVPAGNTIILDFSEAVNVTSIFYSIYCDSAPQTATISGNGTASLELDPDYDLPAGSTCTVTIFAAEVSDVDTADDPDVMESDYSFSFTVSADDPAPYITDIAPADLETDVARDADIVIEFNEAVTVTEPWFSLSCDGTPVTATPATTDNITYTITPDSLLPWGASCTLNLTAANIVDSALQSLAGMDMSEFSVVFDAAPTASSTSPASGSTIVRDADLTVNFSEAVDAADGWFTLNCSSSGVVAGTTSGSGTAAVTINPAVDLTPAETCTLTINAPFVTDVDTDDPYDAMQGNATFNFTVSVCGDTYTPINQIQGSGTTPIGLGASRTTEGIVTTEFSGLSGFYLQAPASDDDSDPATSEGIFIYGSSSLALVQPGDYIRVSGTVAEYQSNTQLTAPTITVCTTGMPIPAALTLDLPIPGTEDPNTYLERYEGMLVTIPQTLTIQQNYFQGRYGQLTLGIDRLFGATNGMGSTLLDNMRAMIIMDDASSFQNLNPISYYPAEGAYRAGDSVSNLVGILDQGAINTSTSLASFPWRYYRIQPVAAPTLTVTSPRPTTPPTNLAADLVVVGANVLNYFTTLDQTPYPVGSPYGGGDTPRGADSATEFTRQQAKLMESMAAMNADVYGLIEIESWDGADAVNAFTTALNAKLGATVYDYIDDPATGTGGDFIQQAIIYKTASVTPVGAPLGGTDAIFDRAPIAQLFEDNTTGDQFWVVVNHFKSKGSCPSDPTDPNADQGDGQGCWNAKRVEQAEALLTFISTELNPISTNVLIIGDLNAYGAEDPINTLTTAGLVNELAENVAAADRYSYVFDGQAGYLDHGLSSAAFSSNVIDAAFWHVNADEPEVINYNTEYKGGTYSPDLYTINPFRSSDHDPVMLFIQWDDAPEVASHTPLADAVDVALDATIDITFSEDVALDSGWFEIDCDGTIITATVSGSGASYTLTPDADLPAGVVCTVTILASQVADLDAVDPLNMVTDYVFSFTTYVEKIFLPIIMN